jgi:hypothetical protein
LIAANASKEVVRSLFSPPDEKNMDMSHFIEALLPLNYLPECGISTIKHLTLLRQGRKMRDNVHVLLMCFCVV